MVSTKKADNGALLEARFVESVNRVTPKQTDTDLQLLIALSGGVDSVVLLSLASRFQQSSPCAVRAVYVDHGLQSQSSEWGDFCASLCAKHNVSFCRVPVSVDLGSGLSPEAAARDARYDALREMVATGEYLCTAHHADDQAETLLLQLFRGAGVNGLAAMPECRDFGRGYLLRPLLQTSQTEILHYARLRHLSWCEDPSNSDCRYDRNYLRHEIFPLLQQRWERMTGNVSRSAAHCAEAMELIDELAAIDCGDPSIPLSINKLQTLSNSRRKNVLRYWINHHGYRSPSTVQLLQICTDLIHGESGSGRINFGDAQLARYQDELFIDKRGSFDPLPDFEYQWPDSSVPLLLHELGWHLDAEQHDKLRPYIGRSLVVRNRRGGETWRAEPSAPSVSIKTLLQQRRVPPWQRSRLAFVFDGSSLIDICAPEFTL